MTGEKLVEKRGKEKGGATRNRRLIHVQSDLDPVAKADRTGDAQPFNHLARTDAGDRPGMPHHRRVAAPGIQVQHRAQGFGILARFGKRQVIQRQ